MKRKSVITIETRQRTVIQQSSRHGVWCEQCSKTVKLFSLEQAAQILLTSEFMILRFIRKGRLHYVKTPAGKLLICDESLFENEV